MCVLHLCARARVCACVCVSVCVLVCGCVWGVGVRVSVYFVVRASVCAVLLAASASRDHVV